MIWTKKTPKAKAVKIIVFSCIATIAFCSIFFLFPHTFNRQWLINVTYLKKDNATRVVSLYKEVGNSDDGSYLTGYWMYLHDPVKNKQLDKIFIKRYNDNEIPPTPFLYFLDNNEIWIIGGTQFSPNDGSFVAVLKINNDHFEQVPTNFLNGWTIQSIGNNRASMVNKFNEPGCMDIGTRKITSEYCPYIEDSYGENGTAPKSCFFFVKNMQGSTRSHLYFYRTTSNYPPPGIFSGMLPEDGTIPGWHLMDAVNTERSNIREQTVNAYKAKFDSTEALHIVGNNLLFNLPNMIGNNDSICTVLGANDDGKTYCIYQLTASGKQLWKINCPKLRSNTYQNNIKAEYTDTETILIHPENWVIAVDNSNGRIKWQCPN